MIEKVNINLIFS